MADRPRVVMLAPERPDPPTSGGQLRMRQHIAVLRALGWDVRVVAFIDPVTPDDAAPGGPWMEMYPVERESPLRRYLRLARAVGTRRHPRVIRLQPLVERALASIVAWRPDLVVLEYSLFAAFLPLLRRALPGIPVIVDAHNAESALLAEFARSLDGGRVRWMNRMRGWWMIRIEATMLPDADEIWVPSDADAAALRSLGAARIQIVPNAVDTDAYLPVADAPVPRLVFSGTMDYPPNIDAATWLCERIMPIVWRDVPAAQVDLVGKSPAAIAHLAGPAVAVTGFVPDPRPHLAQATVIAVPVRIGSGTRLKILEALAMEKAVVTTRKGCQGLDVADGTHLVVADGADAFAAAVIALLRDPDRRRRLGSAGRRLIVDRYSWRAVEPIVASTLVGSRLSVAR
ncbi:MAG TPA: glycosyltransferase family 4 protein [bacterium]